MPDEDGDTRRRNVVGSRAWLQSLEPGSGHALVGAAGTSAVFHQHSSDVHRVGV